MRKTSRNRLIKPLIIMVMFFCAVIWYYMLVLVPIIKTYCKAKINALTEQALNVAVSNVINTTINYDSIMTINYSPSGDINYISANQYMINTITREIIKDAHERIKMIDEEAGMNVTFFDYPRNSGYIPTLMNKMKEMIAKYAAN